MTDAFYMGFTKEEWKEIARSVKNTDIKTHIYYNLGMNQCPRCRQTFSIGSNFCSRCGWNIKENIAWLGLEDKGNILDYESPSRGNKI